MSAARVELRTARQAYLRARAAQNLIVAWCAFTRWAAALEDYRLSKTHDLEYCIRLAKAGVDVRALGSGP